MGWKLLGLCGTGAVLGGYAGGYFWAQRSVPEGCELAAFNEGIFMYLCPGEIRSVGMEVTGAAILVGAVIGFFAWLVLKPSIEET